MRFWQINVFIVSAGVGDLIEEVIYQLDDERSKLSLRDTRKTLKIISNFGCFDEHEKLTGFTKPYVTSVNKCVKIKDQL